jgi:hypothetical protein
VGVRKADRSGFLLSQYSADGGSADVQTPRDFRFADSLAVQFTDFGGFDCRSGGSAETRAALPGMVQSSTNAFAQDVVFERKKSICVT